MSTGDDVVITRGPHAGARGWVLGWRGNRPIVALVDVDVECDPADVRSAPRLRSRR